MRKQIEIVTPQFKRKKYDPLPGSPPADWTDLKRMNSVALKECGLRVWDAPDEDGKVLMLLPGEWHHHIPTGFELECISGQKVISDGKNVDDDIRGGMLAYGIRARVK